MPGTHDGGKPMPYDVMNYSPPKGPTNINDPKGPGLHGHNCGTGQKPTSSQTSGSPGNKGTIHHGGSQK